MRKVFFLLAVLLPIHAIALSTVDLAWDAPADASRVAGYRVCYGAVAGSHPACLDAGTALTISIPSLPDGNYFFAAKSYAANGQESGWSNEVALTLNSTPPGAPANLRTVTVKVAVKFINGKPVISAIVSR